MISHAIFTEFMLTFQTKHVLLLVTKTTYHATDSPSGIVVNEWYAVIFFYRIRFLRHRNNHRLNARTRGATHRRHRWWFFWLIVVVPTLALQWVFWHHWYLITILRRWTHTLPLFNYSLKWYTFGYPLKICNPMFIFQPTTYLTAESCFILKSMIVP